MGQYNVIPTPHGVKVHNLSLDYTLEIEFDRPDGVLLTFLDVHFFHRTGGHEPILISERDLKQYFDYFSDLKIINPKFKYLEIGAGLGGFIPFLALEWSQRLESKPIVIDPADYRLMAHMLRYAKELRLGADIDKRLDELIQRAEIILDPEKVYLVNMALGEAIRSMPELQSVADVVIDLLGPVNYPWTEISASTAYQADIENIVLKMEKTLLKPHGKHLFKSTD